MIFPDGSHLTQHQNRCAKILQRYRHTVQNARKAAEREALEVRPSKKSCTRIDMVSLLRLDHNS
jgi:hypothetical protein